MEEKIYISNDILSWDAFKESAVSSQEDWKLSYRYLHHAESLLMDPQNEPSLSDAIINLNKAVNHRINTLNNTYKFKKIPDKNKPKGLLDLLSFYGIVKPTMLNKLYTLRNDIEHQFKPPPNVSRCAEFVDFVWYFLKSTDAIAREIVDTFLLEPEGSDGTIEKEFAEISVYTDEGWEAFISGMVPANLIADNFDDAIEINYSKEALNKYWKRYSMDDMSVEAIYQRTCLSLSGRTEQGEKAHVQFSGLITNLSGNISNVARKYFEIY